MNRTISLSVLALSAAAALAACGSSGAPGASSTTSATSGSTHAANAKPASHAMSGLHVAHTKLGNILVNGNGMTLYMLTSDGPNQSHCNATCLHYWPLVPASQGAHASGVTAKVGSTKATSGASMLTVGGWPLYTYVQDSKPGDVTGQGINTFGGKWYVLSPSGHPIKGSAASSSPSSTSSGGGYGY
ncbi:MAG TPA: hypothetical protein VFL99_09150 [Segeticoccus sp.]|uniref:COG4315 family predicted lipoprotein n=1 Tax=Segeticoccus sp. TaxID=2706531 RepID=UPI002D7F8639|nr:hypothetical protein [Segeticoccus sp.]HET8600480.1 hypothetical protein [Segeticoccus sp.]